MADEITLRSELGVVVTQEIDTKRVHLKLDGVDIFVNGLPATLKSIVYKSYDNLVKLRKEGK